MRVQIDGVEVVWIVDVAWVAICRKHWQVVFESDFQDVARPHAQRWAEQVSIEAVQLDDVGHIIVLVGSARHCMANQIRF